MLAAILFAGWMNRRIRVLGYIQYRQTKMPCYSIQTHLRSITLALHGIAGYMHRSQERLLQHVGINIGFVFPCVQYIRMTAMQECLFVRYSSPRCIDNKCVRTAFGQKSLIA